MVMVLGRSSSEAGRSAQTESKVRGVSRLKYSAQLKAVNVNGRHQGNNVEESRLGIGLPAFVGAGNLNLGTSANTCDDAHAQRPPESQSSA